MKIKKAQPRDYTLRGETIKVYPLSAIRLAQFSVEAEKAGEKVDNLVSIFTNLIFEATSLKDDNSLEELKENLSLSEVMTLGKFIMSSETDFISAQNSTSHTTDSE